MLATPGLTAIEDRDEAWAMLVDDALRGVEVVRGFEGPIVDVGLGKRLAGARPGGGLPDREVTLLDSNLRKAAFLERAAAEFPNVTVIRGARRGARDGSVRRGGREGARTTRGRTGVGLPLVREGGAAVLWLGPSADLDALSRVSEQLGGSTVEERGGLAVARKIGPTPAGFPRRPGLARKRPLA